MDQSRSIRHRRRCPWHSFPWHRMAHPSAGHFPAVIRFVDVHKSYRVDGRDMPALQPFSLDIMDGEVFGIIGLSGAGKSTLIRLINLLERPSGGRIFVRI